MKKKTQVLADGIRVECAHTEVVGIDTLKENPKNPNTHPPNQIRLLAKVIENQGWRSPIVVSNQSGLMVKGHGRLMAARELGVTEVPVDRQDYENEAMEKADLLADNIIPELAEMNNELLVDLLDEVSGMDIDFELTGYEMDDLGKLKKSGGSSGGGSGESVLGDGVIYKVVVECKGEEHQIEILEEFQERGLKCQVLML